jgi:bacillithiol biosynthesis cysteine-adding enzyme BshC
MANDLSEQLPAYNFVPVYYMGSEDADLDELGNITLQQKKLIWNTQQTGAVGRMKVDKDFIRMINEIEGQIAVNPFGKELIDIFRNSYTLNTSIQESTFKLVNTLFGKYGLLAVIPDNTDLKRSFIPVVEKELTKQFSEKEVTQTVAAINEHYKLKQTGRGLNLFYLIDDKRERIEVQNGIYTVEKLDIRFSYNEIIAELQQHPERFSANVILRPVFQETILPNIAFIGGGGEISYWLQLKNVFHQVNVDFPPIFLRNSFLIFKENQEQKLAKMSLSVEDLFAESELLFTNWVKQNTTQKINLTTEKQTAESFYEALQQKVELVDTTLTTHTKAIAVKAFKKIEALEKKLLQAEKRKFIDQKNQLINIKQDLFYNNNLQERTENFAYYYSVYGSNFLDMLLDCSYSLKQEFALIKMST